MPVANRVDAGKRPRRSMSPTMSSPRRTRPARGRAAGGATIIAQVARPSSRVDWRLSAQDAIALPVLFAPGDTIFVEQGSAHEAMIPALVALGHKVEARPPGFKANAVEYRDGRWIGAADPRSEGTSVGE